jgi:hypothetical protein
MKLIEFMDLDIDERGPSSRALCLKARRGKNIGVSQKSSCISQGLLPRNSEKKIRLDPKQKPQKIDGRRVPGPKYGGPYPDMRSKRQKRKG